MRGLRFCLWIACLGFIACTPGAPSATRSSSQQSASAVLVGVSLLRYGASSSTLGTVGGFHPAIIVVASGTTIQFHNEDGFAHTATAIGGAAFPSGNPIAASALMQSGSDVSQPGWSSGQLAGGAFSQALQTSKTGTYLFGCFYHYPLMRGAVIVQ